MALIYKQNIYYILLLELDGVSPVDNRMTDLVFCITAPDTQAC